MAALVTPLDRDRQLDHDDLERLLCHILPQPVTGICPAGSVGEGPLLPRSTRAELTSVTAAMAPAGTAVIPTTAGVSVDTTLADIDAYASAGATAVLVPPPLHHPVPADGFVGFYQSVLARAALPVLLDNFSASTEVLLSAAVVSDLARDARVIGIKDSSRDLEHFSTLVAATEGTTGFDVLTGSETLLLASLVLGGTGTVAASVNLVPDLVTQLYDAAVVRRLHQARQVQQQLLAVVTACRRPGFPCGWKAALHAAGLCGPTAAEPGTEAGPEAVDRLVAELGRLEILPGRRYGSSHI